MSLGSNVLRKSGWKVDSAELTLKPPRPFDILSFTLTFRRKNGRTPTPEEIGKARAKHLLRKSTPQRRKTRQIIQVGDKRVIIG